MQLRIVTPRAKEVSEEISSVTLPGGMGEVTILPGHAALMSTLEVGVVSFSFAGVQSKGQSSVAVNRGFFEVLDDSVTVLTETAERGGSVDVERAQRALVRGRDRLEQSNKDPNIDVARAEYAIRRALSRLSAAGAGEGK